jgi:uncharacterized protein (DUF488 family)
MSVLYTIGHSTHTVQRLIELLSMHTISAVGDVRSSPYSRYNPQFNRELLQNALREAEIEYVFLGKELGARSLDSSCYVDGQVQFDLVAESELFHKGLVRLRAGMDSFRIALLCAEKDPITCHRMILVCRNLRSSGMSIQHILEDGSLEDNRDAERRLMRERNIKENDLFDSEEELIQRAYDIQGKKIAFTEKLDE